jgi:hypothetical protein
MNFPTHIAMRRHQGKVASHVMNNLGRAKIIRPTAVETTQMDFA